MGRRLMMMKAYRISMFAVDEGAESCYERILQSRKCCRQRGVVETTSILL